MSPFARVLLPASLAASLLAAADGRAQAPPDTESRRAQARAIAEQGDAAFAAGRCDQAEPQWRRADSLYHAPTLMLRVARCQSLLGRVVEASATLRAIVDEPLAADAPAAFVAARESATNELPATSERIASLRVVVVGSPGTTATVEIDGVTSAAGAVLSLDPGEHRVYVRALGAVREQVVTLADGEKRDMTLTLSLETRPPSTPVQRKVGYVMGAAGAVAVVVGGVLGVLALSTASDLSNACGGDRRQCPPDEQSNIAALRSRALAADITLGGGAALLVAGAIVTFTSSPPGNEAPVVRLSLTGSGVSVGGAF
jgi:hypothetical protein